MSLTGHVIFGIFCYGRFEVWNKMSWFRCIAGHISIENNTILRDNIIKKKKPFVIFLLWTAKILFHNLLQSAAAL